jgi:hypothetical protein
MDPHLYHRWKHDIKIFDFQEGATEAREESLSLCRPSAKRTMVGQWTEVGGSKELICFCFQMITVYKVIAVKKNNIKTIMISFIYIYT